MQDAFETMHRAMCTERIALRARYQRTGPNEEMLGIDPKLVPETNRDSFYMDCNRQGIRYGPKFQSVEAYAADRTYAKLRWEGDWIAYLDGVFQVPCTPRLAYNPCRSSSRH